MHVPANWPIRFVKLTGVKKLGAVSAKTSTMIPSATRTGAEPRFPERMLPRMRAA
jgi:hypothetical protein